MSRLNITRSREELEELLANAVPATDLIPELVAAARNPQGLGERPSVRMVEEATADAAADAHNMPQLTYTLYRNVQRYTDRTIYQDPRGQKYGKLSAVAFQVLIGNDEYINLLHDYVWSICEETVWILPQREDLTIDLRTAATTMDLAEIAVGLAPKLEDRLIQRIRDEIERRVFADYLENHGKREQLWWKGTNNWNGVCNGGIGAGFLLLEEDISRLAHALEVVLEGLQVFVDEAFDEDGASGEGAGYWQYGLSNFGFFAEMLRLRTGGAIDLLDSDRMREIARFAPAVMLSPGRYFPYSDCNEETALMPGLITRLAERTGVEELRGMLAEPASLDRGGGIFHTAWRDALWWDGVRPDKAAIGEAFLPVSGVARLVSETSSGAPVVLAAKAGHNGVPHNHNDVGTFVLHVDGETFLCDPERGIYDNYKIYGRYNVIFANSFGHSLPVIGGTLQSEGREFGGTVTEYAPDGSPKAVEMEIHSAYQVDDLRKAQRTFRLEGGEMILEDTFAFAGEGLPVEEALVTWNKTMVSGSNAYIVGDTHLLQITIEEPVNSEFALAVLEKESARNRKPVPLKRLSFKIPASGPSSTARVRMTILPQ